MRSRRALAIAIAAACLFALTGSATGDVDAAHRSGKLGPRFGSSLPSFFDGGENAFADDDDALTDPPRRRRPPSGAPGSRVEDERLLYLRSGSLARYLGLDFVRSVHVPVPVNFVFVGFDGDGHLGLHLDHEDLARWFEHMDHVRPHVRVPRPPAGALDDFRRRLVDVAGVESLGSDAAPARGYSRRRDARGRRAREDQHLTDEYPEVSRAHLNFTCHVVDVGPNVLDVFERAISTYARPVGGSRASGSRASGSRASTSGSGSGPDPDAPVEYHVDAGSVHALVDSLVEELDLLDSYTLVVLNPRKSILGGRYGYRRGFSAAEIEELRPRRTELIREARRRGGPRPRPPAPAPAPRTAFSDYFRKRSTSKFGVDDRAYQGGEWARRASERLELARASRERDGALFTDALATLTGDDPAAARRLTVALEGFAAAEAAAEGLGERAAEAVARARGADGDDHEEDCIVDAHVGRARASFLDLSAGPFAWGPLVGGEGVRGASDVPDVDLRFGEGAATSSRPRRSEEKRLERELETMADAHFVGHGVDPEDERAYTRAEIDVYEAFARKHCEGRERRARLCEDLRRRVEQLRAAEAQATNGDVAPRSEDFSMFGDDDADGEVAVAHDLFMAELGRALSSYATRVAAPATALGRPRRFRRKIRIVAYAVSLGHRRGGATAVWGGRASGALASLHGAGTGAGVGFDADAIRDELRAMTLGDQTVEFSVHRLAADDDPALAVAFASALREGTSPALAPDGSVESRRVRWVDSAELRRQLSRVAKKEDEGGRRRRDARDDDTLEVPVFVLEPDLTALGADGDADLPLLIDGHHQAKSLDDMVLVAQSSPRAWDGPLQCDGRELRRNLRDPSEAAVAAVVEHVGGVLPTHVGYNLALGREEHEWLWSVGSHPFSATAAGASLSTSHRDVAHREYALAAMDAAAARINRGVETLAAEMTHEQGWELVRRADTPLRALMRERDATTARWRDAAEALARLDFDAAVKAAEAATTTASAFLEAVEDVRAEMHPLRCVRRRRVRVTVAHWIVLAVAVAGIVARRATTPRRVKPKVN